MWIDATDLVQWADRRESQHLLPEVIRRLVHATVDRPRQISFPSGESVQTGGWDGIVDVPDATSFVPSALSLWELSSEKDVRSKAESDYLKRTSDPLGYDPSSATFVFVTPRRWTKKEEWIHAKKSENQWADVRVYDADDLEQWLELAPTVAAWFAARIGKHTLGCQTIEDFWEEFANSTNPAIPPSLLLGGRAAHVDELIKWLKSGMGTMQVQADSPLEALAFLAAVLEQSQGEEKSLLQSRVVLIRDPEVLRQVAATKHRLLIALDGPGISAAGAAVSQGHQIYLPCGREAPTSTSPNIELKRLLREDFIGALRKAGIPEDRAETLARQTGGSLSALRRRISISPAVSIPTWAEAEHGPSLVAALLANTWDESNQADRDVISRLAATPYEEIAKTLVRWSHTSDAPVRQVGNIWSLQAPVDAWFLLGRFSTKDHLGRLEEVVTTVLGEEDPRFDLAPEDRWLSNIRSKTLSHSHRLRKGLADTLALLSIFGDESKVAGTGRPVDVVNRVVWKLLGESNRVIRWRSVAGLVPILTEAAPEIFLRALEDFLNQNETEVGLLFEEEGLFGTGGPYVNLLWALEGIAWYPELLARVTLVLARLARLDPGGKLSNRPANSLRHIFLVWRPNTGANLEQRLAVIELLLQREPEVGWNLLLGLLPKGHDVSHTTHEPRWRAKASRNPVTRGEYGKGSAAMIELAISAANGNGRRLSELVTDMAGWAPSQRDLLLQKISLFTRSCEDKDQRKAVWDALRSVLHMHRKFQGEKWTLHAEELARLDDLYSSIEPLDSIQKHSWLFDEHWPDVPCPVPESPDEVFRRTDAQVASLRKAAVSEMMNQKGIDGVLALAGNTKIPHVVGRSAAEAISDSATERRILDLALGATEAYLRVFGRAFVSKCVELHGNSWVQQKLREGQAAGWSSGKLADFCLALQNDAITWTYVRELGIEVDRAYWEQCYPYVFGKDLPENLEYAIEKLLAVERFGVALQIAAGHHGSTTTKSLLAILTRNPSKVYAECEAQPGAHLQFDVETLINALESKGEVVEAEIARLEWTYLPLLEHTRRHPLALHRLMAKDPGLFVDAICWAFRAHNGAEGDEDSEALTPEMKQARARLAYDLLESWQVVPGMKENGELDESVLWDWVSRARDLCGKLKRIAICDEKIGSLLAHSPSGPDGVWPHPAVRNLVETLASRHLEEGIDIGLFNSRGVVTKSPNEGGEQERNLASRYRAYADATAMRWPRTSALLRQIGEQYDREAKGEEIRAEQLDL